MVYMILALLVVFFISILIAALSRSGGAFIDPKKAAGVRGERLANKFIAGILNSDDLLLNNVSLSFDGKMTELDSLIINESGVYIIEVKNYTGRLVGLEDDFEWDKYTVSEAGHLYHKTVKNPIKQVKRQIYILSGFLKKNNIHVWIEGYVILLHGNSPVHSNHLIDSKSQLDRMIHQNKRQLDFESIEKIRYLFST